MSSTTIGSGRASTASGLDAVLDRANSAQAVVQRFLARAGQPTLRVSLGLVFVVFGALKFIPGASPVEGLVSSTWNALSFGMIDGYAALAITATLEVFVGLTFITGVVPAHRPARARRHVRRHLLAARLLHRRALHGCGPDAHRPVHPQGRRARRRRDGGRCGRAEAPHRSPLIRRNIRRVRRLIAQGPPAAVRRSCA